MNFIQSLPKAFHNVVTVQNFKCETQAGGEEL